MSDASQEPEFEVPGPVTDEAEAPESTTVDGEGALDEALAEAEATLQDDFTSLTRERDEFRALAQRIQADFENYRKQIGKRQTEHLERAGQDVVEKLLPVLDACDAALAHGAADVEPVYS